MDVIKLRKALALLQSLASSLQGAINFINSLVLDHGATTLPLVEPEI
ncbi:MAG TPA: hypothetical protein VF544_19610 [Pyrinomonadaceae bacterium]|jgi:hypothetical protein